MQLLRINETGAREIISWLEEYSTFGFFMTSEMLWAWCEQAELNEGHLELRSLWSKDGRPHTMTVSAEGIDLEEVEVE
jgi:hypothetical protein